MGMVGEGTFDKGTSVERTFFEGMFCICEDIFDGGTSGEGTFCACACSIFREWKWSKSFIPDTIPTPPIPVDRPMSRKRTWHDSSIKCIFKNYLKIRRFCLFIW